MLLRSMSPKSTTGVVAFYMSGSSSMRDCDLAADLLGAAVFRGQRLQKEARRVSGQGAAVWLDPADYEQPHTRRDQLTLFGSGDPWADDQRAIGVVELLSPGAPVPADDGQALDMAITAQAKWLDVEGGGRLSLVLDWRWLTGGLVPLLSALELVDGPVAIALADPKDPLEHPGAVRGLAALSSTLPDLMVLRCDMGAFGALAHGATVAAIGTGTSVRHVVPEDRRAHGGGGRIPNVFVASLLDFRSPERLSRLPDKLKPTCSLACCNGRQVDRFDYMADAVGARIHNLRSLAHVADLILGVDAAARPAVWKAMTTEAVAVAHRIEMDSGQPFEVRRQIAAWAIL